MFAYFFIRAIFAYFTIQAKLFYQESYNAWFAYFIIISSATREVTTYIVLFQLFDHVCYSASCIIQTTTIVETLGFIRVVRVIRVIRVTRVIRFIRIVRVNRVIRVTRVIKVIRVVRIMLYRLLGLLGLLRLLGLLGISLLLGL
jgi:hypothetical protein